MCINILVKFLDFVKRRVLAEPEVVHCFERSAEAMNKIYHSCVSDSKDTLPEWYKERLFGTQDEESD